jgi:Raf kinase inhibitor-like YbhB/YbcL family protein
MYLFILLLFLFFQTPSLSVSSPDFEHEGKIPERFTCDGDDAHPTLHIQEIPAGTKSLAIIMEDPDVPLTTFNHWVVWNIAPVEVIEENSITTASHGYNSLGKTNYSGPCPPAGMHRYFFKVYALNAMLDIEEDANKWKLESAMADHILARGEIMGWYQKK